MKLQRVAGFVLLFGALALVAMPALAEFETVNCGGLGIACDTNPDGQDVADFVLDIINFVLVLVGVVALAVLIWGGVSYIISLGDDSKIATAKKMILYAIIGLIIVGLSGLIVNFTINLFSGA